MPSLTSFLHTRAVSFVVDCGPPSEFVKINFDDAYDANHHQSASEIVARNEEGDILLSCSEIHHGVTSAFAAEAIACRKAVQVGGEQEWSKVLIEGDSRNLEVDSVMCLRPNPTSELLILEMRVPEYVELQRRIDRRRELD